MALHMEFMMVKEAVMQVFLQLHRFFLSLSLQKFPILTFFIFIGCYIILVIDNAAKQNALQILY
jgi:hypothetical protein